MNKRRALSIAGIVPLVSALLAGCGSAGGTSSANGSESGSSGSASSSGRDGKQIVVGHVLETLSDPSLAQANDAIKAEAKKLGWKIKTVNSNNSQARANDMMQQFVNEDVDAIIVDVYTPDSLKSGIAAANEADIPIGIDFSNGKPNGVAVLTALVAGKVSTRYMVNHMPGQSGNVLAFTYHVGEPCVANEAGFDRVMKKYPKIQVKKMEIPASNGGWYKVGEKDAKGWLASHPAGSGNLAIWGCWDAPTMGASVALQELGRTDVKTYGIYGETGALENVKKGIQTATWWFSGAKAGRLVVRNLAKAIKAGSSWQPKTIDVPPTRLTKKNIDAFLRKHPGLLDGK
jgi:ribose transport system substrate-binding protein